MVDIYLDCKQYLSGLSERAVSSRLFLLAPVSLRCERTLSTNQKGTACSLIFTEPQCTKEMCMSRDHTHKVISIFKNSYVAFSAQLRCTIPISRFRAVLTTPIKTHPHEGRAINHVLSVKGYIDGFVCTQERMPLLHYTTALMKMIG